MPVSKTRRKKSAKVKSQLRRYEDRELNRLSAMYGIKFNNLNEARTIVNGSKNAEDPLQFYQSIREGFDSMIENELAPIVEMGKTNTQEEIDAFIKDFGSKLYHDIKNANTVINATREGFDKIHEELKAFEPDEEDKQGIWLASYPIVSQVIEINDHFQESIIEMVKLIQRIFEIIEKHAKQIQGAM